MFTGHDLPDEALVRACLDSYRSLASTPDRLVTSDDLLRRSQEHTELLATIADGRPPARHAGLDRPARADPAARTAGRSATSSSPASSGSTSAASAPAAEELAEVDAHLVRPRQGRVPVRGRMDRDARRDRSCAATPGSRPTTTSSGSSSSPRSGPSSSATSSPARRCCGPPSTPGTWHILKSDHLRAFLARDPLDLADLEPYLGLDPPVERGARSRCRCSTGRRRRATGAPRRGRLRRQRHTQRDARPAPIRRPSRDPARHRADARRRARRPLLGVDPRARSRPTATFYGDERYADRLDDPGPEGRASDARAHGADARRGERDRRPTACRPRTGSPATCSRSSPSSRSRRTTSTSTS